MIDARGLLRFVLFCVILSTGSTLVFLAFGEFVNVRGVAGGVGCMTAFLGAGVAFYYVFRIRNLPFVFVTLWSLLAFAFWLWKLSETPGNPGFKG